MLDGSAQIPSTAFLSVPPAVLRVILLSGTMFVVVMVTGRSIVVASVFGGAYGTYLVATLPVRLAMSDTGFSVEWLVPLRAPLSWRWGDVQELTPRGPGAISLVRITVIPEAQRRSLARNLFPIAGDGYFPAAFNFQGRWSLAVSAQRLTAVMSEHLQGVGSATEATDGA